MIFGTYKLHNAENEMLLRIVGLPTDSFIGQGRTNDFL